MATIKKALTDAEVRGKKTPGTYPEGTVRGLYLIVTAAGTRSWRLRCWIDGKEHVHTLGRYYIAKTGMPLPQDHMGLVEARAAAEAAKAGARAGNHPKDQKKAQQVARKADRELTFRVVAAEFVEHNMRANDWSSSTEKGHRYALAAINEIIGDVPVKQVSPDHIKAVLKPYQESKTKRPTAERFAFGVLKRVLAFAKTSKYVSENVAIGCEGLLSKRKKGEPRSQSNHAAILDPAELGVFLRKLEAHPLHSPSWYGMRLLTMLPARPSELASMKWADIDGGWWVYRMPKVDKQHRISLPHQAVAILRELQQRRIGQAEYVLPSRLHPDKPMHPESMRLLLTEQMGYGVGTVTCHGWRATWRTCGKKYLKIDPDVLELAMGHETKDPLGRAYNRDDMLDERAQAAQLYANWLDSLKTATHDE